MCTNGQSSAKTKAADICSADGYLVVNFKFLNHSKFHEHPQGCSNHGIHIEREVIKMDIINAKLWHQRDVCCLKTPKGNFWFNTSVFFSFFHSYKKQTVHQFWPANTSPAWFKCWAVKVFIWETQTHQANRVWEQWEREEPGMSRKYVHHPNWSSDTVFRRKADHFTATAITQYIPMQITVL